MYLFIVFLLIGGSIMVGFKIFVFDIKDWWGGYNCFYYSDLIVFFSVMGVICFVYGCYVMFYNEWNVIDVYFLIFFKFVYI